MLDAQTLYRDFKIPTGPSHHKHSRRGWLNVSCPFCTGNFGFHLGYNLKQGYFKCYRCGWHPVEKVLGELVGVKGKEKQKSLLRKYWIDGGEGEEELIQYASKLAYPLGCEKMSRRHKLYLMDRGFDPLRLEKMWGLLGTDHKDPDYKLRIIAPVLFKSQEISFQGRDITGKQGEKYKTCSREAEVFHHKYVLYGYDEAKWDACVVVEGITGVWRFGPGALGTFGAQYKRQQINLIASRYKRAFLCFDEDEAGQIAQDSMDVELSVMGVDTVLLELDAGEDSGSVCQQEADQFMQSVRK